ncbi:hypothetical protein HS088_TW10G00858 [Tripterygium wilfordii]|uniref:Uncharacterized protein n=1 Tax=Tripterygium wilfordii TaxID=458696 RepID=A0A7J7D6B2_TRIWF|nr:uncharacterized protein LOC120007897 [Tripterygium wilfordii]KAF5741851.1 hypothetical protein HS088_TW10G00858 [Tripterygium wilfordii]
MPFTAKIQPIDSHGLEEPILLEPVKPVVKSRWKRLFERQFLRNSVAEKTGATEELHLIKHGSTEFSEFEPSSVCLDKMVQNFLEENNEKHSTGVQYGRHRSNCFNRNGSDSSDDELDSFDGSKFSSSGEACEILKNLVLCASVCERNLLADTAKIVEKDKISKCKNNGCRKVVTDGLVALGYDASICKSSWEKSPSYPAGEYEYIDVIIKGERLLIDIDFRSEFEIARSTKEYKTVLQSLPYIFVGKADRLQRIIAVAAEAAKHSLKKKGMDVPPWRRTGYFNAKWLSPNIKTARATPPPPPAPAEDDDSDFKVEKKQSFAGTTTGIVNRCCAENTIDWTVLKESLFTLDEKSEEEKVPVVKGRILPAVVKSKSVRSGLASVIEDEP